MAITKKSLIGNSESIKSSSLKSAPANSGNPVAPANMKTTMRTTKAAALKTTKAAALRTTMRTTRAVGLKTTKAAGLKTTKANIC